MKKNVLNAGLNLITKPKVISLFSGVGGSSQGYKDAGCEVVAAVEFLDYQAHNYRLNHSGILYEADIRELEPKDILKDVGLRVGELDILDGSPPCSGFSTAGIQDKGWSKVKAYGNRKQVVDDLFFEYTRFIKEIQPKVFVAENVSGLVKGSAKGYFNMIMREMTDCGYNVKAKLLNAKYYGVPQSRQRVIFIGVRNDLKKIPVYPEPSNKIITLGEAFENIVNKKNDLELSEPNRKTKTYKEVEKIKPGLSSKKFFSMKKASKSKTSCTLTAQWTNHFHWTGRHFTLNEAKAIAGFKPSFKMTSSFARNMEACGRVVPPPMMKAIAKTIIEKILK